MPKGDWDFIVPIGRARIVRPGSRCTVLAYGAMVGMAEAAAGAAGVDAEIVDLRTIDPPGLDWEMIGSSVRKTNALLIAERNARGSSVGARIASEAQGRLFDWPDHEIVHNAVTGIMPHGVEKIRLAGR